MRKLLLISILTFLFSFFIAPVLAQEPVTVYFFHGQGCSHCAKEEAFLNKLEKEKPEVQIKRYEVWFNAENRKLLSKVASALNINTGGVPITIVNSKAFYGYMDDNTTGQLILSAVEYCQAIKCEDEVATVIKEFEKSSEPVKEIPQGYTSEIPSNVLPEKIKIPFVGEIATKNLSLPLLTVIIGGIDGFNPCAMWILLFLISLLLVMKSRFRAWLLGSAFILASAISYFVFMSAWLNLFLFLGLVFWVRVLIGGIAIFAGAHQLRKHFSQKTGCPASEHEKKLKLLDKIKNIIQTKKFALALGGIAILAFSVNLLELMCSAGLPAIYTQVLALSSLAKWQYYAYLLLYIFVFMLDDLIIFTVAMITLRFVGISTKYGRYSALIGGIIMLIIGVLLILKPGWLMFG